MVADMYALVTKSVSDRLKEKGFVGAELNAETTLLGGDLPLDSLDLATVLIEMQEQVGQDPFASGFMEFRTIGDLVNIYRKLLD
jgi:acyl carrier protein